MESKRRIAELDRDGDIKNNLEEQLSQSESQYRTLFEGIAQGVFYQRADGTMIDCNSAALELFGLTRNEFLGRTSMHPEWKVVSEDGVVICGEEHPSMQALATGKPVYNAVAGVYNPRKHDYVWLTINAIPLIREGADTPEEVLVTLHDITARKSAEVKLRESEERLSLALEASNDGLWDWHLSTNEVYFSPRYYTMLGYKPYEFPPSFENWACRLHPEEKAGVVATVNKHLETGEPFAIEFRMLRKDGKYHWLLGRGKAVGWDQSGVPTRMAGTHVDIARLKQAEEAIRRERDKAQTYLDIAGVMFVALDIHGTITLINQHAAELLEDDVQSAIGKNWFESFIPETQRKIVRNVFDRLISGEIEPVKYFENEIITTSGVKRLISWHNTYIEDDHGNIIGALSSGEDVTIQRKAEQSLRASEERYRRLAEDMPVYISTFLADGTLTYANKYVADVSGYNPDELVGKNFLDMISEDARASTKRSIESLTPDRPYASHEQQYVSPKGDVFFQRWINRAFFDEHGDITHIQGIGSDITPQKKAEDERERLQRHLVQSQRLESVGRLAGGIAHDFNNLLTTISGNVSLAISDLPPDDDLVEILGDVHHAADSAANLTRQLLAFSRKQIIEPRIIDLNKLIVKMQKMLARLIGEDIVLTTSLSPQEITIRVDPGQIEQIIVNLAVNARDAMPDGGRISIETSTVIPESVYGNPDFKRTGTDLISLTFSDDGEGMTEDTRAQIFDPFFTTKREGKGTGLGLATVYGIVAQHNGIIEVDATPGKGATFIIYFPKVDDESEKSLSRNDTDELPVGSELILVVEDEKMVRETATRILERQGYKVHSAAGGADAIRSVEKSGLNVDLLLTDMVMPSMNGIDLAARLKSIQPDLKVLYTSGYTDDSGALRSVVEKTQNFIAKPYTPQSLSQKVREVLNA